MKRTLEHLPQSKRDFLARITEVIRESAMVEMIILFGSHARDDWGYMSDFDILVLVGDEGPDPDDVCWSDCRERAWKLCKDIHVEIIVDRIADVHQLLEQGNSFYRDVLTEGIALHDSGRVELPAITELTPAQRLALARVAFPGYFTIAEQWYEAFKSARATVRLGAAAHDMVWRSLALLDLHQAAEYLYKAVSLAFVGYLPNTHSLAELDWMSARAAPALKSLIPIGTPDRKRLTRILSYGYVARHDPKFSIMLSDLDVLAGHVHAFHQRAELACRARVAELAAELPINVR